MKRYMIIALYILILVTAGCEDRVKEITGTSDQSIAAPAKQVLIMEAPTVEAFSPRFEVRAIDKNLEQRISGISWREGAPVDLNELSYVRVTYWGFDDKEQIGELIVNKAVAEEVAEIFQELYEKKFPIEKIRLIDEYSANDTKSMEDNNTSAFCFREVAGKPGKISKHSYGLAIDINPVQNPYVYKTEIAPISGKEYVDRENEKKGMVQRGDACYEAFVSRGWQWGGDWKYEKDYQHFQKSID